MPAKAAAKVPITGILRVTGQGGNQILQMKPFKSMDTICGHYTAADCTSPSVVTQVAAYPCFICLT
jgi:hypothetical protein